MLYHTSTLLRVQVLSLLLVVRSQLVGVPPSMTAALRLVPPEIELLLDRVKYRFRFGRDAIRVLIHRFAHQILIEHHPLYLLNGMLVLPEEVKARRNICRVPDAVKLKSHLC